MATKCPDCGFDVSVDLNSCPQCGCPIEHRQNPPIPPAQFQSTQSEKQQTQMEKEEDYKTFSELFWSCQFYKILKGKHFDLGQRTYEFGVFIWEMIVVAWNTTWNKFAKFTGRASRREYWSFLFGLSFLSIIPLFFVIALIPYIAVCIRRMHDTNHCGWWCCVPFAVFFLSLKKSDASSNKYGIPNPAKNLL